ncbi:hypothetical protein FS837_003862 [Tulasnella sp. UAMH 9824]|nr:hypothetical protein FS837_003862 [Tulasnella sp. UAMH 9824]
MSSPPPVELFTGRNWEECHRFILAIRTRAMWEGKQRDPAWMADFAASYFWHKALVWHCRLPEDVSQDWFKLQTALVERWPPPEDDSEPQLEPTPAPAPPSNSNDKKAHLPLRGVLKLVIDESNTPGYVEFSDGCNCRWTSKVKEALRVRSNSLSDVTLLERIVGRFYVINSLSDVI